MPRSCHTENRLRADIGFVGSRTYLAIGITLASVAVGGWKSMIPGLDLASGSAGGTNAIAEASAFGQASGELAAYQHVAGTYAGGALSPLLPVRLAWANDTAYCVQGTTLHLVGPVGMPQPGPCPAG
jgi:hypothetical protein